MPARGSGSALVPLAESPRMTGRRITWAPRVKMSLRIRWRVSGAVTVLLWCADGADVIDILPALKDGDSGGCPPRFTNAFERPYGVSRRDIDACVGVGVAGEAAAGADESGLALARILVYPPAGTATQAGVSGPDLLHPA